MKKSKIALGIVLMVLLIGTLSFSVNAILISEGTLPNYELIHVQPWEADTLQLSLDPSITGIEASGHHSDWEVGDLAYFFRADFYTGYYYVAVFQLRAIGTIAEVWVQYYPDLGWPEGDPRPYPIITDEQIAYVLDEFESHIYPTDTTHFGTPDFHDGSYAVLDDMLGLPPDYYYQEDGRNIILVSQIRDLNWYDYTYPYWVGGFYSGTLEFYFDRNIITIDCAEWERRLGPEGYEWIPGIPVTRPYSFEGIIAHEYQHLLHADWVPGDSSYMNEGFSMYAEVLCGYGVSWDHVNHFLYAPDNSLTKWGDQGDINILADYGLALLWTLYLEDNYSPPGESFVTHYMEAGIPADYGVNAALAYGGYSETFDDVYYEWNLVNYLHSAKDSPYTYESIDLNPVTNPEVISMNVHELKAKPMSFYGSDFGSTITIRGYDTDVVDLAPYSSDYILFTKWKEDMMLYFDGGEASDVPYGWEMVDGMWYSDGVNLLNTLIATEAHVGVGDDLEITTYWDIEVYWDFGFVQVSTDGGQTWASLENVYTTYLHDPDAYFPIVENLPGLTGWSGDWVTMTFDLSVYEGMDVMLGFRYMTDWATLYEGWYISSVKVGGTDIPLDSFEKVAGYPSYFTVTIVHMGEDPEEPMGMKVKAIETMDIDHSDETGEILISGEPDENVLVIVSNPSDPTLFRYGVADYEITIEEVG